MKMSKIYTYFMIMLVSINYLIGQQLEDSFVPQDTGIYDTTIILSNQRQIQVSYAIHNNQLYLFRAFSLHQILIDRENYHIPLFYDGRMQTYKIDPKSNTDLIIEFNNYHNDAHMREEIVKAIKQEILHTQVIILPNYTELKAKLIHEGKEVLTIGEGRVILSNSKIARARISITQDILNKLNQIRDGRELFVHLEGKYPVKLHREKFKLHLDNVGKQYYNYICEQTGEKPETIVFVEDVADQVHQNHSIINRILDNNSWQLEIRNSLDDSENGVLQKVLENFLQRAIQRENFTYWTQKKSILFVFDNQVGIQMGVSTLKRLKDFSQNEDKDYSHNINKFLEENSKNQNVKAGIKVFKIFGSKGEYNKQGNNKLQKESDEESKKEKLSKILKLIEGDFKVPTINFSQDGRITNETHQQQKFVLQEYFYGKKDFKAILSMDCFLR